MNVYLHLCIHTTKMQRILFFDTETTGLPKRRDVDPLVAADIWPDLVSISWQIFEGKKLVEKRSYLIQPNGWTIPTESIQFHGITQERALTDGVPLHRALSELQSKLATTTLVVAHNLQFDKGVVFNAYKWRLQIDPRQFWPSLECCTMQLSKDELKIHKNTKTKSNDPYKFPGLDELYTSTFNKVPPLNAHSSDRDVEVLQQIWWARWPLTENNNSYIKT